ncbi:MAG: conjugal transfer protein TrbI [Sphingomonas bacterium]|uniref:TrbI/VirB10 family protein n=1 Tax=Sphingomonas bacterium TaxID=1895847 RepID=UPI00262E59BE|nr:TrbI/VirB10 family protein [Sphingomonas bacterium]MDB5711675.1 conjugal transfer protein TrbI [Sphingomonas bacterium]
MTDETAEAPAPAKADPETLVLRGSPGRVVRFRRGAVVAIAALGSTAIVGTAWFALKPTTFHVIAANEDRADIGSKAPADALANAPKSYGDVPQLGPPLPGDLGRPILEHQQSVGTAIPPAGADQRAQAAEAERQRLAAEQKAARESGVMMQVSGANRPGAAEPPAPVASAAPSGDAGTAKVALDPERDPNGQQRKADFVGATDRTSDINPHSLVASPSPFTLMAGSVISASLITGLNSDLPGLVTAQVTENAYDSVTGRILLIPQGSRLVGSYDSVVAFGQKRALVVWQRIILPDGSSVRIDNVPATDTAGYAGLSDKVDVHTWQLLKGVALSTLLGVGTQLSFGSNESDLVRAIRESAQQSGSRAADQLVTRNLNIQPTIRVRPGWPLRVVVHKDIVFATSQGAGR